MANYWWIVVFLIIYLCIRKERYPKGAKVYIGVSLKQLRAYAASSAALSRGRYIMMSLAPMIPGILSLAVFLVCPITMKWLMTICVVP